MSDPGRIADVLTAAGFHDVITTALEGPLRLGDDADDAVDFLRGTGMARALLDTVDAATAARGLAAVAAALRPYERPEGLALGSAAWLVTTHRG